LKRPIEVWFEVIAKPLRHEVALIRAFEQGSGGRSAVVVRTVLPRDEIGSTYSAVHIQWARSQIRCVKWVHILAFIGTPKRS
jgi:hypothetical protein